VEDFTEFEQRAAYFDGDPVIATKKGVNPLDRGSQVHFMAELQELMDFPPAPKLGIDGRLNAKKASQAEVRGETLFFGKAKCSTCHPLRGIKDSPPYLHDGRLLTLDDTVAFFDLILETRLSSSEKADLVAFLRAL
jgi:cytochrome c peroxidase